MIMIIVVTMTKLMHTGIAIGIIMPMAITTTIIMNTALGMITVGSATMHMLALTPRRSNGDLRPARRAICRPSCSA